MLNRRKTIVHRKILKLNILLNHFSQAAVVA